MLTKTAYRDPRSELSPLQICDADRRARELLRLVEDLRLRRPFDGGQHPKTFRGGVTNAGRLVVDLLGMCAAIYGWQKRQTSEKSQNILEVAHE